MKITYLMVATFMLDCVWIRTRPCKYFQLNSAVFNESKGIFSKLDIDRLIPEKWRLPQCYDDGVSLPARFPVFVKPEWGQNAQGIYRADNAEDLSRVRQAISSSRVKYLIQLLAPGKLELEVFYILHHQDPERFAHLTITRVINAVETNPVNSIHNSNTRYHEITDQFSAQQKQDLWSLMSELGRFGICRVGLRTDSIDDLLAGNFHIIEINLFIPMPINMLDAGYGPLALWKMLRAYMMSLARITKARNRSLQEKPVFTRIMLYNRSSPFLNFIRERI